MLKRIGPRALRRARLVRRRWRRDPSRDLSNLAVADIRRVALSIDPSLYAERRLYETDPYELRPLPGAAPPRVIHPAYRYDLPGPRLLGDAAFCRTLGDWYGFVARKFAPGGTAVVETVIDDAVIFHNAVFRAERGTLYGVYESCREDDRAVVTAPTRRDLQRTLRIDEDADHVFLGSAGSGNYGHFLTDDAARLVPPATAGREVIYLMSDHGALMNERRRQLVALATGDPAARVRFIAAGQPVQVRRLRYASRPSHHPFLKSPAALAQLRAAVLREALGEAAPRRGDGRLFIARRAGSGRRLGNDGEVEAMLRARGFRVLDPLAADVAEQAAACAGAGLIVGVMGAAMTNTLFAAPGTRVVHLAPTGWEEPYFWDLAGVCGHDYTAIYGAPEGDGSEGGAHAAEPWNRPFRISADHLLAALDAPDPPR